MKTLTGTLLAAFLLAGYSAAAPAAGTSPGGTNGNRFGHDRPVQGFEAGSFGPVQARVTTAAPGAATARADRFGAAAAPDIHPVSPAAGAEAHKVTGRS